MVLGLLIVTAIPTVTGVAEAISSKKQQNAQMKEKIKFNMTATLSIDGGPPTEAWVVLYGGRVSSVLSFLRSLLHRQESCFLTFSFVIITSLHLLILPCEWSPPLTASRTVALATSAMALCFMLLPFHYVP